MFSANGKPSAATARGGRVKKPVKRDYMCVGVFRPQGIRRGETVIVANRIVAGVCVERNEFADVTRRLDLNAQPVIQRPRPCLKARRC